MSQHIKSIPSQGYIIYEIDGTGKTKEYSRKDFYKICLVTGKNLIEYADRGIQTYGTTLFFGTPHIPYSWEIVTKEQTGYTILFTEQFLKSGNNSESLLQSPFFKIGGTPIFFLKDEQREYIAGIFRKMIAEQNSDYPFKDELLRNCINLIIHEALKLQPSDSYYTQKNASSRITSLFLELLERQFPVVGKENQLAIKSPHDFALHLSVHVNHLNRAVKEITGKSTSSHISERIVAEAKDLLRHTDRPIADIAYSLGFD
ncbi:AraC family transcriptional regulator [Chitinophaga silvatica]|uniref:AraC family transcriptional regulator n=1 Tax=Chitinophaga silvatica TaxID=2282649 RepID=A0A3E1YGW9_9BACT|nr:helix-turn-helix domain-containing protein [Chitinophaga silvatica]RFS26612.1 AraC family transcriptional regulator [Chitinophaga silvatica]